MLSWILIAFVAFMSVACDLEKPRPIKTDTKVTLPPEDTNRGEEIELENT